MRNFILLILIIVTISPFSITKCTAQIEKSIKNFSTNDFVTTWKTDNPGSSNNTSITIPTHGYYTYNYDVDWNNDGIFDEFGITGDVTHDFGSSGTFTIRIRGVFPAIYFNNSGDKDKILSVDQWGNQQWKTMLRAFYGCSNLSGMDSNPPDLSNVTNMESMFRNAVSFNAPIGNWNTSNITSLYNTFNGASVFNQAIGNWDTSNVEVMRGVFRGATSFNQNIGQWDTGNVYNMMEIFQNATSFNQNINSWNTSNVTLMQYAFENAESFNQPLDQWDTGSVTNMKSMFANCDVFNQNINNWNTSNVTNMQAMFLRSRVFNQPLNNWDTSNVTSMYIMFESANQFNQPLNNWDTSNVTNMNAMFMHATNFNQNINSWNVSSVTNMSAMFAEAINFNQPLNNWDTSAVTDIRVIFYKASNFNQPLNNWILSGVTDTSMMFQDAISFNQDLSDWDMSNVRQLNQMLRGATSFDQNLSNWNIGNVQNANQFLLGARLSTTNYDALLIGWQGQPHQIDVVFSGGNSTYCQGENARTALIADGWNISDGGLAPSCNVPDCTQISNPADGATNVSVSTSLTWSAVSDATGYYLTIGTTPAGNDVLNNYDVGNTTSYTPANNWLENTTYYVTVTAYNSVGAAQNCNETNFTTETLPTAPRCTSLINPADGATNVSVSTSLTWSAVSDATGYYLTIGTTPAGNDVLNNYDVGNTTSYTPANNWLENTTYYVTVTAYNSVGAAQNCNETNFTTENNKEISIMNFFTPNNDGQNDTWHLLSNSVIPVGMIYIFDRYGRLIHQMRTSDSWNGYRNSNLMPADDYWFKIDLKNDKTLKGHFSLIR